MTDPPSGPTATRVSSPGAPDVDARQTHISTLFFTPDRVFKLLKPVNAGFLDHTTAEHRIRAIDDELAVNRRFAPDVYLGTCDVTEFGALTDRMLVMRRLPDSRRLSGLVGDAGFDDHLRRIAHTVAAIHADAPIVGSPVLMGTADGLLSLWESSFEDIAPSVGTTIDPDEFETVRSLARRYLEHSESLFDERRQRGLVRDGHGDLTAEDIFVLDDGPRLLDCLAFDRDLRVSDVLADIAFLVMDVERLAGQEHARDLLRWYCEFSGEHHPSSLAHHYVAYRAHVRAKVALMSARQGDEAAGPVAARRHAQALAHLERAQRRLVLVGGGPGSGKTTLSRAIADACNWSVVDSDTLRKDLRHIDHGDHRVSAHPDLYDAATTDATYAELCRHAEMLLRAGESVVIDATFGNAEHRSAAHEVARRQGAEVVDLECRVSRTRAEQRIRDRAADARDASDATPDLVSRFDARHDRWPNALPLDTDAPLPAVVEHALHRIFDGPARHAFDTGRRTPPRQNGV